LPCEPAPRQTEGQFIFAPRFRPVPSPRAAHRPRHHQNLKFTVGAGEPAFLVAGAMTFVVILPSVSDRRVSEWREMRERLRERPKGQGPRAEGGAAAAGAGASWPGPPDRPPDGGMRRLGPLPPARHVLV
jgi:hypothetical protein